MMTKMTFCAAILFVVFSSCSKDKVNSVSSSDCPQQNLAVSEKNLQEIEGFYIIKFKDDAFGGLLNSSQSYEQRNTLMRSAIEQWLLKVNTTTKVGAVFTVVFKGFEAQLSKTQLAALGAMPTVDRIEQEHKYAYNQTCNTPAFDLSNFQLESYGTKRVGSMSGAGKRVWIIDTGIDLEHPDLNVNKELSRNFVDNTLLGIGNINANDGDGHGTHVAGIIGAKNNNFGTKGVAAGAELVAVKVLDNVGDGTTASVIQGVDYVAYTAEAGDVANMSLGGAANALLDLAVQGAASNGILFSIAAGNDGESANLSSPGRAEGANIFTVSAIDENDRFAKFSNFGNPPIDYAQPGVNIVSTWRNGLYKTISGTSMAAPHLAGVLLVKGNSFNTDGTAKGDPDNTPDRIAVTK